jgi:hypothetical protein
MHEVEKVLDDIQEILDATPDINYNVHVLREYIRSNK